MNEFEKLNVLKTPLGDFKLIDKNGKEIELEVMDDSKEPLSVYLDNDSKNIIEYSKYKSYIIRFDLTKMSLNEEYTFKFSKKWKYDDSDERVFTYSYNEDDKVIAFSFQEINDWVDYCYFLVEEKEAHKVHYDTYYDKNNVYLEVIDKDRKYGYCCLTWAWDIKDHIDDFDDACVVNSWKISHM